MNHEQKSKDLRRRSGLVRQLLIVVNLTLAVVLGLFIALDWRHHWDVHLQLVQTALNEEAKVLVSSVTRLRQQGGTATRDFLNEVCASMQESVSPGHFIMLRTGEKISYTYAHARPSQETIDAIKRAAISGPASREAQFVVGSASRGDIAITVSEHQSVVKRLVRSRAVRSIASIVTVGLALGVVLNVALTHSLRRPLRSMVNVVRRLRRGELGARMPGLATAELGVLADEFDRMAAAIQRAEEERRLRMDRARRIQENLRPDLSKARGLHLTCIFEPAADVAGDYYDVVPLPDGSLLLCVADVTGHGVPAAIGAAMLKALLETITEREADPARILEALNATFCRVALAEDFATMILARVDVSSHRLTWASAGHEPSYLLPRSGPVQLLTSTGPVLGIDEGGEWAANAATLARGDRLVVVTDGVPDTPSASGESFGRERLQETLEETRGEALDALRDRLVERIAAHRAEEPRRDDITMLAAEIH